MVFYPNGDALVKDDPDYKEYLKLDKKDKLTYYEYGKIAKLDDKLFDKYEFGKAIAPFGLLRRPYGFSSRPYLRYE